MLVVRCAGRSLSTESDCQSGYILRDKVTSSQYDGTFCQHLFTLWIPEFATGGRAHFSPGARREGPRLRPFESRGCICLHRACSSIASIEWKRGGMWLIKRIRKPGKRGSPNPCNDGKGLLRPTLITREVAHTRALNKGTVLTQRIRNNHVRRSTT